MEPRPLRHHPAQVVLEHLAYQVGQDGRPLRPGPLTGDDVDHPPRRRRGVALEKELNSVLGLACVHPVEVQLLQR